MCASNDGSGAVLSESSLLGRARVYQRLAKKISFSAVM